MNINLKKISLSQIIILGLLIRLILLPFGTHPDVANHVIWGKYGQEFGFKGYYDWLDFFSFNRPNQPPLTILIYTGVKYFYDFLFRPLWFINLKLPFFPSNLMTWYDHHGFSILLKLPSTLADIGIGWFIYQISQFLFKNKKKSLLAISLYLFNPLTIYNSAVWGQTDALINLFFVAAITLLLIKPKLPLAIPLIVLSLLIKGSLLILLPLAFVFYFKNKPSGSNVFLSLLVSLGLVYLITQPFAPTPFLGWTYRLYQQNILQGELHYLTANAFNPWALIYGFKPIIDSFSFIGNVSAYEFGLLLFSFYLIFVLISLFRRFNFYRFLLAVSLVVFAAFLILTRMHERYLFPLFIPLTILCVKKIISLSSYIALSLIHLINLYHLWWFPNISPLISLFSEPIVERVLIVALLFIFLRFNFTYFLLKNDFPSNS